VFASLHAVSSLVATGSIWRWSGLPRVMERTDYRVWQDWKHFSVPGATVIAQSSFWLENCRNEETFEMYINGTTIPRYKRIPHIRKREDLNQFVRTHLISNATGEFRYHTDPGRRIPFGRAKDNTDWHFMRSLYVLFVQEVMPLFPKKVIDPTARAAAPSNSRCSGSKRLSR
jgi:hypothetical protein